MFLRNAWYVACTPDEIATKPLGRQICGERIAFFRGANGKVAAVEDFCPHRGAPLSLGFVEDGRLTCGYHGLSMGCDGRTASMPGQRVAGFPPIKTFAVEERYGFIWVWPGEAAQADPALIHHLEWADADQWAYGGGLFHIHCDYRLMIDNLMDLVDLVLIMSVNPGFGGQSFIESQLKKIEAARKRIDAQKKIDGRDIALEVDGGITPETARRAIAAGADTLVAGTSVFQGGPAHYAANIAALRG